MYSSDDSLYYETTYSQDERIDLNLRQERATETARNELVELERQNTFEEYFAEKSHDIFNLPGIKFLKFTHLKIKFSFTPSLIVTHVSKKVIFYCSLKYYERYKVWNIRRDSFPANFKWRMYRLFYIDDFLAVHDDSVLNIVLRIHTQLKMWAQDEEAFRLEKFMRYQEGEDMFLDSDDEELFLNEDQRKQLHKKRQEILKRLLPPSRLRQRRIIPRYEFETESD